METVRNWLESARVPRSVRPPLVLPRRFEQATPDALHEALRGVVRRYCREFSQHAERGVAPSFFGRARTYKTYAAVCVARWVWHQEQLPVEFVDAGVEFLRLEQRRFSTETEERLDELCRVPFLVLDDITNVRPRTPAETQLTAVASARFGAQLSTIYTGNWNLVSEVQAFVETYSPALGRRILDGSQGFRVVTG